MAMVNTKLVMVSGAEEYRIVQVFDAKGMLINEYKAVGAELAAILRGKAPLAAVPNGGSFNTYGKALSPGEALIASGNELISRLTDSEDGLLWLYPEEYTFDGKIIAIDDAIPKAVPQVAQWL